MPPWDLSTVEEQEVEITQFECQTQNTSYSLRYSDQPVQRLIIASQYICGLKSVLESRNTCPTLQKTQSQKP